MSVLKKLHKWLGLLVGVQVLIWVLSGLVISLLNPAKVTGKQWAATGMLERPAIHSGALLEPYELPAEFVSGALGISLENNKGQAVYRIERANGDILVDARDGSIVQTSRSAAEQLAQADYTGGGEIVSTLPGRAPDLETRNHSGDYWKVKFSDSINTTIYISASTGEVLERRNNYWRVRDFFWMLHIMDYSGREDFNNALVIVVALVAAWLGIFGFILLFGSFNRHDFYFLNLARSRNEAVISLSGPSDGAPLRVNLRRGSNLFLSLATHGINLPSICGGGGECGKCMVQMEGADLPEANRIEQGLIPRSLRERGFRLACQQEVKGNMNLKLREDPVVHDR